METKFLLKINRFHGDGERRVKVKVVLEEMQPLIRQKSLNFLIKSFN